MSRFNRLITSFTPNFEFFDSQLSLDLGSSQTRIMWGQDLVWDQASLLVWHTHQRAVVAIGDQALQLEGKTPPQIKLVAPVKTGKVADLDFAELYLRAVRRQLPNRAWWRVWWPAGCRLSVPHSTSPVEKDHFIRTVRHLGCRPAQLCTTTQALAHLPRLRRMTQAHGVIDLGAQTVELGVLMGQEPLFTTTLTQSTGDDFTAVIKQRVLTDYELIISRQTAQKIKHQIGGVMTQARVRQAPMMTISGKHAQGQDLQVVRISADHFWPDLVRLAGRLTTQIQQHLAQLPTEVMSQLKDQGFYVTGGASQLLGLKEFFEDRFDFPVLISPQPELDVVASMASYE